MSIKFAYWLALILAVISFLTAGIILFVYYVVDKPELLLLFGVVVLCFALEIWVAKKMKNKLLLENFHHGGGQSG